MPIKGFLVGNGVTNWKYDTNPSFPQTLEGFDMAPHSYLAEFEKNNCTVDHTGSVVTGDNATCLKLWN